MPCCAAPQLSPLVEHAKSLQMLTEEPSGCSMHFPMHTVSVDTLLQMTEMAPYEELKATDRLVKFCRSLGKAMFISHQWIEFQHPDPELKQLKVLQDALSYAMSDLQQIPVDLVTEVMTPGAKGLPTSDLRSSPLFAWYDYFCCPQLEYERNGKDTGDLANAIRSIPAYIAECSFFVALCPVVENSSQSKVFTPGSWAQRGWCRVERAFRELSEKESWIIMKSAVNIELVHGAEASVGGGPPGEGQFTRAEDLDQLAPVLAQAVRRKLYFLLRDQDFVSYRVLLNLQAVYLKGLRAEPCFEPVPDLGPPTEGISTQPNTSIAMKFLYQHGFARVRESDRSGWSPLHYAALRGDSSLIKALLMERADPNSMTKGDQPRVGMPPLTSALAISLFYHHNEAARLLISAKANVNGTGDYVRPAMTCAADANNPEGIRILCEAGCSPHVRNLFGISAFESASACGSLAAMEELIGRGGSSMDASDALYCAMLHRGGSAELVQRLVALRADVNRSRSVWKHSAAFGCLTLLKSFQHRFCKPTAATRALHHAPKATPLMLAIISSQYGGAAALVAAGAKLDMRNLRGWTAADFANGQSLPAFLLQAFNGNPEECERIAELACGDYVEEVF